MSSDQHSGIALVTALLYLLVLTLIASSLFQVSILQFKMSQHFQDADIAFQQAESALAKGQADIDQDRLKGEGYLNEGTSYQFERLLPLHCGFWLYQVNATGRHQKATKRLESVVLLPVPHEDCPEVVEKRRRIVWKER